jgi:serine/threonine protein kinase
MKRFEREAKSLARLIQPNIVKVLDYGEFNGRPYLVMPLLSGGTLKDKLANGPLRWVDAVRVALPMTRALAFAHAHGLIHRDVKPSNILLTASGDPMLADFGIAKIISEEVTLDLTGTNAMIGTPEYMAPEQVTSKNVDARADIYSLGVVLYEMVTGRKPFTADTPMAVLLKHATEPLPRPSQFVPSLPADVETVLARALAKRPEDRFQTMEEFAAALEELLMGRAATGARVGPAGSGQTLTLVEADPLHPTREAERPWWRSGWVAVVAALAAVLCIGSGALTLGIGAKVLLATSTPTPTATFTITPSPTATSTPTQTPTPKPPTETRTPSPTVTPKGPGALIPAGEFTMGRSASAS